MKNVAAIILARGGSKGIPNKNIIDFCGKPLISWSIKQAKNANGISSVWVSSDSDKILSIAKQYGAKTVKRPKSLAADTSTSESGWLHAINYIEEMEGRIDLVVGIQPTSPIRESSDFEKALRLFRTKGYDSIFSGSIIGDFLIWEKKNDKIKSINYNYNKRVRRQEFSVQYVENGSFYLFRPEIIRKLNNRLGGRVGVAEMEFWKMFEIDSMESLELCRTVMKHYLL